MKINSPPKLDQWDLAASSTSTLKDLLHTAAPSHCLNDTPEFLPALY